ncbi:MAG: RraA family protein [Proteobacteria bacterium]|nr:RraA family protein [Burkholderiales bacterium]
MLVTRPMPEPVAPELLAMLLEIDPVTVGHFRHWGFVDPAIMPVIAGRRVVGTAVTVMMPGFDTTMMPYVLDHVRPGDVLIIDRLGDNRHACMGGVVALAAKLAGVAAVVIDGRACDFAEIRQYDLPVWCRGDALLTGQSVALGGALNLPVACGGVAVLPGQAVLADTGGVLVVPAEDIAAIHATAMPMQTLEPSRLERLRAGEKLGAVNGASAKVAAALARQQGRGDGHA